MLITKTKTLAFSASILFHFPRTPAGRPYTVLGLEKVVTDPKQQGAVSSTIK